MRIRCAQLASPPQMLTRRARLIFAGAVDASVGAKRVLHEVKGATMERTGMFVNCEDGLQIPW